MYEACSLIQQPSIMQLQVRFFSLQFKYSRLIGKRVRFNCRSDIDSCNGVLRAEWVHFNKSMVSSSCDSWRVAPVSILIYSLFWFRSLFLVRVRVNGRRSDVDFLKSKSVDSQGVDPTWGWSGVAFAVCCCCAACTVILGPSSTVKLMKLCR